VTPTTPLIERASIECPICHGPMTLTYGERPVSIFVCRPCGSSLSVPDSAWPKVSAPKSLLADGRF
jgi:hypothetical protein